jgi:hypothetical protein
MPQAACPDPTPHPIGACGCLNSANVAAVGRGLEPNFTRQYVGSDERDRSEDSGHDTGRGANGNAVNVRSGI